VDLADVVKSTNKLQGSDRALQHARQLEGWVLKHARQLQGLDSEIHKTTTGTGSRSMQDNTGVGSAPCLKTRK